jgi:RNA-binding protein 25
VRDARAKVAELVDKINKISQDAADSGLLDKERYVIPPHLHDLQEADLPETQRGLVISEIAQFRERAAKKERERAREIGLAPGPGPAAGPAPGAGGRGAPSGPKMREWGKPQQQGQSPVAEQPRGGFGKGPQGYDKPVNFVKGGDENERRQSATPAIAKTDEELEQERKEARKREEDNSFRDVSY